MRYGKRITSRRRAGSGPRIFLAKLLLGALSLPMLCGNAWGADPPSARFSRVIIPERPRAGLNEHLSLATPPDVTSLIGSWAAGDRAPSEMVRAFARQHSRREGIPLVTLHQDVTGNSRLVMGLNGNGHPGLWWNKRF